MVTLIRSVFMGKVVMAGRRVADSVWEHACVIKCDENSFESKVKNRANHNQQPQIKT